MTKKRAVQTAALLLITGFIVLTVTPAYALRNYDHPWFGYGSNGDGVKLLQRELKALALYDYEDEPSGVFDLEVYDAVRELQAILGVEIDGIYGPKTHAAYLEALETGMLTPVYTEFYLESFVIGIDPGHQLEADYELESVSPRLPLMNYRMSKGSFGVRTGIGEYSINLSVSLMLKEMLELNGATVVMSRTTNDVSLSNVERATMMNNSSVDFWIRIHCDYSSDSHLSGARILLPHSVFNSAISESSAQLGSCIIRKFCETTGSEMLAPRRLSNQAGFNWSESSVVVIEMGYLSHSPSDLKLNRTSYQELCAAGIFEGIVEYCAMLSADE